MNLFNYATEWDTLQSIVIVYAAVMLFLGLVATGIKIAINKADSDKRVDAMKSILWVVLGAIVVINAMAFAGILTRDLHQTVETVGHPVENTTMSGGESFEYDPSDEGLIVSALLDAGGLFVDTAISIRDSIVGEELSLMEYLFDNTNPLVNMRVPGSGSDLYAVMVGYSFIIYMYGFINIGVTLMKSPISSQARIEAAEQGRLLISASIMTILAIPTFQLLCIVTDDLLSIVNGGIGDIGSSAINGFNRDTAGLTGIIAQMYMAYLEFKIWLIFMSRAVVINVFYVLTPLAFAIYGANRNFETTAAWFNVMIKFIFLPFYYALILLVITMILNQMPNGDNPVVIIVLYGTVFSVANMIKTMFQLNSIGGRMQQDANTGGAGLMMGAGMVMMATMRGGKRGGGVVNAAKNITSKSSGNISKGASTLSNALKNTSIGSKVANSSSVQKMTDQLGKIKSGASNVMSHVANSTEAQVIKGAGQVVAGTLGSKPVSAATAIALGATAGAVGGIMGGPGVGIAAAAGVGKGVSGGLGRVGSVGIKSNVAQSTNQVGNQMQGYNATPTNPVQVAQTNPIQTQQGSHIGQARSQGGSAYRQAGTQRKSPYVSGGGHNGNHRRNAGPISRPMSNSDQKISNRNR